MPFSKLSVLPVILKSSPPLLPQSERLIMAVWNGPKRSPFGILLVYCCGLHTDDQRPSLEDNPKNLSHLLQLSCRKVSKLPPSQVLLCTEPNVRGPLLYQVQYYSHSPANMCINTGSYMTCLVTWSLIPGSCDICLSENEHKDILQSVEFESCDVWHNFTFHSRNSCCVVLGTGSQRRVPARQTKSCNNGPYPWWTERTEGWDKIVEGWDERTL